MCHFSRVPHGVLKFARVKIGVGEVRRAPTPLKKNYPPTPHVIALVPEPQPVMEMGERCYFVKSGGVGGCFLPPLGFLSFSGFGGLPLRGAKYKASTAPLCLANISS